MDGWMDIAESIEWSFVYIFHASEEHKNCLNNFFSETSNATNKRTNGFLFGWS